MQMDKAAAKDVKGSVKKAVGKVTGAAKSEPGKKQIALGNKKDALYNNFST
jgi:uncharacterized protein YjbJ (UPF0337 family)